MDHLVEPIIVILSSSFYPRLWSPLWSSNWSCHINTLAFNFKECQVFLILLVHTPVSIAATLHLSYRPDKTQITWFVRMTSFMSYGLYIGRAGSTMSWRWMSECILKPYLREADCSLISSALGDEYFSGFRYCPFFSRWLSEWTWICSGSSLGYSGLHGLQPLHGPVRVSSRFPILPFTTLFSYYRYLNPPVPRIIRPIPGNGSLQMDLSQGSNPDDFI